MKLYSDKGIKNLTRCHDASDWVVVVSWLKTKLQKWKQKKKWIAVIPWIWCCCRYSPEWCSIVQKKSELFIYSVCYFSVVVSSPATHTHTSYGFISVCAAVYTGPQQAHTVSFALKANCMELLRIKVWIMIDAFINSSALSCPSLVGPCSFQTQLFNIYNPASSRHWCGYTAPSAPADWLRVYRGKKLDQAERGAEIESRRLRERQNCLLQTASTNSG